MERKDQYVDSTSQYVIERPEELKTIEAQVLDFVNEKFSGVTNPLGRIVLMDLLSKSLMPEVYQAGMEASAEFRESGGTWPQIAGSLGITPQAARRRLDPAARVYAAEEARARRRASADKPT